MNKLSLNLEQLTVDSFQTTAIGVPRGTVFGEQCTCYTNCTCPGAATCDASCDGTCDTACESFEFSACYACAETVNDGGTCGHYGTCLPNYCASVP